MVPLFDFFLIAFDYILFMLEPIVCKLPQRYRFAAWLQSLLLSESNINGNIRGAKQASFGRPWFLWAHDKVDLNSIGLQRELEAFREFKLASESSNSKQICLERIKEELLASWPTLDYIHLAAFDSIDSKLNWLDYDICLIASNQTDLSLIPDLESTITKKNICKANRSDNSADKRGCLNSSKNNRNEGDSCFEVRKVYSSSLKRVFLVEIVWKSLTSLDEVFERINDKKSGAQVKGNGPVSIFSIKLLTSQQFQLANARSKLIFCLSQMHPTLEHLYHPLEVALKEAGLMREKTRIDEFIVENEGEAEAEELEGEGEEFSHFTPYMLLLMLSAYLEQEDNNNNVKQSQDTRLSSQLLGFLSFFGNHHEDNLYSLTIGPSLRQRKSNVGKMGLEISRNLLDNDNNDCLRILDPIVRTSELNLRNLCKKIGNQKLKSVLKLFSELKESLENQMEASEVEKISAPQLRLDDKSRSKPSLLESFFSTARKFNHKNKNETKGKEPTNDNKLILDYQEKNTTLEQELNGKLVRSVKPRSSSSFFVRLSVRSILINLIWLLLILTIRHALISYLERVRRDLKDEVREELVQLKYQMFQPNEEIVTSNFLNMASSFSAGSMVAAEETTTMREPIVYDEVIGENDDPKETAEIGRKKAKEDSESSATPQEVSKKGESKEEEQMSPQDEELLAQLTNILMMQAFGNGKLNMEEMVRLMTETADEGEEPLDADHLRDLENLFKSFASDYAQKKTGSSEKDNQEKADISQDSDNQQDSVESDRVSLESDASTSNLDQAEQVTLNPVKEAQDEQKTVDVVDREL